MPRGIPVYLRYLLHIKLLVFLVLRKIQIIIYLNLVLLNYQTTKSTSQQNFIRYNRISTDSHFYFTLYTSRIMYGVEDNLALIVSVATLYKIFVI